MVRIGKKVQGAKYTKRPGAYVIIEHEVDNKIAIVTNGDWFFLGGGIEGEETEIEALCREVIEEAGYSIKDIKYFDKITSWADGKDKGLLDITATIYIAKFDKKIAEPIEKDYKIFWVRPEEYKDKLFHEYQRYVLSEYIKMKEYNNI